MTEQTNPFFKIIRSNAPAKLTAEGKQWLADLTALKEPVPLNARALEAFGVNATFVDDFHSLSKDTVFPVMLTLGLTLPNYEQDHVHLALAKVVNSKEDYPMVEVQFESPSGNTPTGTNFLLCEDGTIQYFSNGWKEWKHNVPTWEFAPADEPLIHWPVTDTSLPPRNLQEEFKRICAENGFFDGPYETLEQLQEWHEDNA